MATESRRRYGALACVVHVIPIDDHLPWGSLVCSPLFGEPRLLAPWDSLRCLEPMTVGAPSTRGLASRRKISGAGRPLSPTQPAGRGALNSDAVL